ncbi:MAG: endonuclease/exonuclease/phosphatase family protein [Candidatus Sericytochromatia bacterium]|nr:endonuclease/exonuclease/phosphatase family protein [Candidatus Sericytochromatia bacterium]
MKYLAKLLGLLSISLTLSGLKATEGPLKIPIYQLQGKAHLSPYQQQAVHTEGVVTAVSAQGFFLQDATGDGNPLTSDAIFVQLPPGEKQRLQPGMLLAVNGQVQEVPPDDPAIGLTRTSLQATQIQLIKNHVALPEPVILGGPEGRPIPTQLFSSHQGNLNDRTKLQLNEGLDLYESLEGMHVSIPQPRVIAPGSPYGELYLLAHQGQSSTPPLNARHSLLLDLKNNDFQPEVLILKDPAHPDVALQGARPLAAAGYRKGDLFAGQIKGILDFNLSTRPGFFVGGYFIYPMAPLPDIQTGGLEPQQTRLTSGPRQLTLANYNVENLSPQTGEAPDKLDQLSQHIVQALKSPDILMLQEVSDSDGRIKSSVVDANKTLNALIKAISDAGGPAYRFVELPPENNQDGGMPGANIRVAYLYQSRRVSLKPAPAGTSNQSVQVNAAGHLSHNPGRLAVNHPAFSNTRKSLAVEFLFEGESIICINNHLSSKRGDSPQISAYQPPVLKSEQQRLAQTSLLSDFSAEILYRRPDAKVVLAGDFNEFYAAAPLQKLKRAGLINLIENLPFAERYTYIHKGVSQTLDHVFVSEALARSWQPEAEIVHLNAEFNATDGAVSDHDPVLVRFNLP